ncbi:hypothetical protein FNV43_RR09598 [Rhamnella rubrinervis]|uniref:Uncharacterized protein n=1 Tax=Rhamnella rubrinervis TaxID=2594499 RepID=A0A8K0MK44_9ROSA|nr:hypothetical protein FNV43_RR09598 [Rhamnella rubrinervis]
MDFNNIPPIYAVKWRDETISFVVLWNGSLVRKDDDIWECINCKSKVASEIQRDRDTTAPFNVHQLVDVGHNNVAAFPNQDEEENYEQLHCMNNGSNYMTQDDHLGVDLGDVGHDDILDYGLDDNDNSIHGPGRCS